VSIAHLLEDFGVYAQSSPGELTEVLLEEERLEAFEKGYQAGWEDSSKAQAENAAQISADFAQNLKDLSFTYHEAYAGLLQGLRPLIQQMVESVLPRVTHETLGLHVAQILQDLSKTHGQLPVKILAAPENLGPIEAIADGISDLPLAFEADDDLADGQVRVQFGKVSEQDIDIPRVLKGISEAISAYFDSDVTDLKDTA